jgi:hypothetical protein
LNTDHEAEQPEPEEMNQQSNFQAHLRKLIQEVQGNQSLSQSEKSRRIQKLVRNAAKIGSATTTTTAAPRLHLDLRAARDSANSLAPTPSLPLHTLPQAGEDRLGSGSPQLTPRSQLTAIAGSLSNLQTPREVVLPDNLSKSCEHYKKRCAKFYFACCGATDPCHRCHAERGCDIRPPRIAAVHCNECDTRQPASRQCINPECRVEFSKSYCEICLVWTDAVITHCMKCGLCRVGAPETLYHCDTCDACFNEAFRSRHKCVKTPLKDQRCPMCLEQTYTSQVLYFLYEATCDSKLFLLFVQ